MYIRVICRQIRGFHNFVLSQLVYKLKVDFKIKVEKENEKKKERENEKNKKFKKIKE